MKKAFYYSILLHFYLIKLKENLKIIYLLPILIISISIFDNIYLISLLNSLSFQIIIGLISISIIFIIFKRYKYGIISLISALYFLGSISVFDNNNYSIQTNKENISISHFNVLRTNKDYNTIINSALNSNSDILSFQEISSDWRQILISKLSKKYPYHIIDDKDNNYFGIALFSKHKITNSQIVYIQNTPNIFANIEKNNTKIDIITVHTNSPISKARFKSRNKHIKYLSEILKNNRVSLLVIGDFNAVPWDSRIINFKTQTNLIDSRKTYSSTWPRQLGKLGIPLDYIFHSKNISCIDFQVIEETSSDHCGITGIYSIGLHTNSAIAYN